MRLTSSSSVDSVCTIWSLFLGGIRIHTSMVRGDCVDLSFGTGPSLGGVVPKGTQDETNSMSESSSCGGLRGRRHGGTDFCRVRIGFFMVGTLAELPLSPDTGVLFAVVPFRPGDWVDEERGLIETMMTSPSSALSSFKPARGTGGRVLSTFLLFDGADITVGRTNREREGDRFRLVEFRLLTPRAAEPPPPPP